jgi:hypothetical protein
MRTTKTTRTPGPLRKTQPGHTLGPLPVIAVVMVVETSWNAEAAALETL